MHFFYSIYLILFYIRNMYNLHITIRYICLIINNFFLFLISEQIYQN